jgi:hypothetical protein
MNTWIFLAFLAVPIIVHLFNFRKTKRVFFSNTKFITAAYRQSRRKAILKHYFVLASRIGVFASLVFFLLSLGFNVFSDRESNASFYLDNSVSSSLAPQGISAIASFKSQISEIIDASKANQFGFLTNDFTPFANRPRSKNDISNELYTIEYSYHSRKFSAILDRMQGYGSNSLYFFTDLQHLNEADLKTLINDTTHQYRIIYNPIWNLSNVFVDSLFIEESQEDPSIFKLTIKLGSRSIDDSNIIIKVFEGDRMLSSVVRSSEDLSAITFDLPTQNTARYRIELSGDQILYDNTFYFTRSEPDVLSVAIISPTQDDYLSSVYGNERFFDKKLKTPEELSYEELQQADVVLLNGLQRLPNGLDNLESTLIIIPGDSIDNSSYSEFFARQMVTSIEDRDAYQIGFDLTNPLFKNVFNNQSDDFDLPYGTHFYKLENAIPVLSLRSGQAFLSRTGNRYFFSGPLQDKHSNLKSHALFLPLMYRIAYSAKGDVDSYYSYPGDEVTVDVDDKSIPLKLENKDYEVFPEFSLIENGIRLIIPKQIKPGFYWVTQDKDSLMQIAINLSKQESLFSPDVNEELLKRLDDLNHIELYEREGFIAQLSNGSFAGSQDLTKYALLLTLFFLIIETLLHRYYK